ncbi:MAG: DUF1549 domain-containing protein [Gemmataceae bacterium]
MKYLLSLMSVVAVVVLPARAEPPLRDFIDQQVKAVWDHEKLTPAPLASDAEFMRRAYLDIIGIIPSYEEAKAFLDDKDANKRAKLIDKLLEHPRYAVHQADVWDLVLFTRNPPGYETHNRPSFQRWLEEQFAKNVAYDKWVGDILKAEGSTVENGPPWFLAQYDRKPEDAAEKITQTFLGVQLQCARCHDHPFEEWKQVDFYGMAAFLARTQVVQMGKKDNELKAMIGERNTGEVLFTGPASQQTPGKKGEPIKPKFLQGKPLEEPPLPKNVKDERNLPSGKAPPKPFFSRKDKLAEWVTAKDNPYFARAVANRIWGQYMGRGLVHPVDNMSPNNPSSHPKLLEACAKEMAAHNYDLKWYIRELCNSKTYQLASTGSVEDEKPRWFERGRVRPLSAEELVESWRVATGYDIVANKPGGKNQPKGRFHGLTWDYMVRFFGKPANGTGDFQGGLGEHLFLNNGQVYQLIATDKGSLYDTFLTDKAPLEERVDRLYLSMLSRPATAAEKKKFAAYIGANDEAKDRLKEAIWVLMTCSEFRFNH